METIVNILDHEYSKNKIKIKEGLEFQVTWARARRLNNGESRPNTVGEISVRKLAMVQLWQVQLGTAHEVTMLVKL